MRNWLLWSLPRWARGYWLLVDGAALLATVAVLATAGRPTGTDLGRFTFIAVTAGVVVVGTGVRSHLHREPQRHPWSVHACYLVAGGLVLPVNLMVLLLLVPGLHGVVTVRPEPHRWVFVLSATALAAYAARAAVGWRAPHWDLGHLLFAGLLLLVARTAVIAVGLWLRAPGSRVGEAVGDPIDVVLGVVALSIGLLMGCAVLFAPMFGLVGGPPMALLERAAQLPYWRRSAQRDAKTGLANAVHWDRVARYELARARSRRQPVAVMLLDLDYFKRVNDEVGHLAGDAALAAVAGRLRGAVRRGDVVGRFGGEEFVVLLPGAEPEEAESIAQRVRASIAEMQVPTTGSDGHPHVLHGITASIGVATSTRHGYELSDLLIAADAALLSAKGFGRNLVAMA